MIVYHVNIAELSCWYLLPLMDCFKDLIKAKFLQPIVRLSCENFGIVRAAATVSCLHLWTRWSDLSRNPGTRFELNSDRQSQFPQRRITSTSIASVSRYAASSWRMWNNCATFWTSSSLQLNHLNQLLPVHEKDEMHRECITHRPDSSKKPTRSSSLLLRVKWNTSGPKNRVDLKASNWLRSLTLS